jgi:hypothetical protein
VDLHSELQPDFYESEVAISGPVLTPEIIAEIDKILACCGDCGGCRRVVVPKSAEIGIFAY